MKNLRIAVILLLVLGSLTARAFAQSDAPSRCKAFFVAVDTQDYATAWKLCTEATRKRFVKAVAEGEKKYSEAEIRRLFDSNDPAIQGGFWSSFRGNLHAEVYVQSTYAVDGPATSPAVVLVSAPNGNQVKIKMFKENGAWHIGYAETFLSGQ